MVQVFWKVNRDIDGWMHCKRCTIESLHPDWAGKSLREIDFPKQTGLLIVAVKSLKSGKYVYNPGASYQVETDDVLIVIGETGQMLKMKKMLGYVLNEDMLPEEESRAPGGAARRPP